jgi:hypothetical protein
MLVSDCPPEARRESYRDGVQVAVQVSQLRTRHAADQLLIPITVDADHGLDGLAVLRYRRRARVTVMADAADAERAQHGSCVKMSRYEV